MLSTSQYMPVGSQFQRAGEALLGPIQHPITNASSYPNLPQRYESRVPMMGKPPSNDGVRRNSRGRESPLLMKTGEILAGPQPLIGFNQRKDPNIKAQEKELPNPFAAFNQHPVQVLTQPIPTLSPEENEYVAKSLIVQENIKNAIDELTGLKKKYGKSEREKRILKALKKQEVILDELEQDLKDNTKRKLDEKIDEFYMELNKYTRGIADESDLRSKYREVQFYAGNFPIPLEYLITEAMALKGISNSNPKYRFQWQVPPYFGLANRMPYTDPYAMYSDPLYLMNMMKRKGKKKKRRSSDDEDEDDDDLKVINLKSKKEIAKENAKEKQRQAMIESMKREEAEKLRADTEKKLAEKRRKVFSVAKKKFKKCVWAIVFLTALKTQSDHAYKQSMEKDFLAERNRKFRELIDPALNMGLYLAKFCENSIIMVIDERASMNIIPQLEKKKKFPEAEIESKRVLIKQKIEVFISDLLKAKVFPIELLQFLSLLTYNGKIAPDNYFYNYEILRLKFSRMRGLREMNEARVSMNISFFFIIRVIIHKMLLQYDKYFKISQKPLINRNIKIISSLIYHITKGIFFTTLRPDANNQNHLSEKFKLQPAAATLTHNLSKTEILPGEEDYEIIAGLYPKDYLDPILSDKAWVNKITEGINYWCKRVHNLISVQIEQD